MLLSEILDKSSGMIKTSKASVSDLLPPSTHKVAGVGAQALAYLHKKYPNKIIKTIQIYGDSDPSYQFLRLILKHQDNPYFPKIYNVKMYPTKEATYNARGDVFDVLDPTGEFSPPPSQLTYTLYVVMEKLTPFRQITKEDLLRFGIEDFPIPKHMKQYNREAEIKFRLAFKDPDWRQLMQQVVVDPKLKQALRLLEPLFRNFEPDMHGSNIMLRGSHLVFVDPISHEVDD
jgi:hypothetical protein